MGTIMDNICMGNTTASYEDVVKAAKECNAHEFIMSLPEGYNTKVKEGNLSEGQRQLICITRLMLRDSQIILLDEATSSIDILNEQMIQEAFRKIMKNKTTIVVAHRLSTIMDSDIILVVKDGRIEQIGKHHELLSNKGFYYRLYESQKR
jgi:ATP-binding cassette subfamily B protein